MTSASRLGLNWLNLLVALMQTAFGAFLSVYLARHGWSSGGIGVLIPLTVADITHESGRFNLAMGVVGLVIGVGGAVSTTLGGAIAQHWGNPTAFLAMALAGLLACLLAWTALPETRHRLAPSPA